MSTNSAVVFPNWLVKLNANYWLLAFNMLAEKAYHPLATVPLYCTSFADIIGRADLVQW